MFRRDLPPGESKRLKSVAGCRTHDEGLAERGWVHGGHLDNLLRKPRRESDPRTRRDHVASGTTRRLCSQLITQRVDRRISGELSK
jgi:hypothetical protein